MLDELLQLRAVARDLPHEEGQEEDNLLIEAVSLLVQRQREAETWLAEQIDQAHERSVAAERHYADLETRLAGLEDQLDRLVRELEPGRGDAVAGQRLARLREQVEDLKLDADGRPLRSVPPAPAPPPRALEAEASPPQVARGVGVTRTSEEESSRSRSHVLEPPVRSSQAAQPQTFGSASASLLELIGPTPQDRFGVVLIFLGIVAVLYAVLTQLRLG